jgi:PAS domain S-box-containing protein
MNLQVREQQRKSRSSSKQAARQNLHGSDGWNRSIQAIINACQATVVVLDEQGVVRYVNGAWRRFARKHGLRSKAHGVGTGYLEVCRKTGLYDTDTARSVSRRIRQVLEGHATKFRHVYVCHSNGERRWHVLNGSRLKEPGHTSVPWILLSHDYLTPTKRITEARLDRNRQLKALLESTPMVPWEADAKTWRITYIGPQAVRLLGYPQKQWYEPDFWSSHLHPDDRQATIDRRRQLSASQSPHELRYRMVAKDGRPVWFLDVVSASDSLNGARTRHGLLLDVSAEAELRERETLLRLLSESIDEIFWFISVTPERLIYINQAVEPVMGHKPDAFYRDPRFWLKCVHEQDRERVEQAYAAWLKGTRREYKEQFRVVLPDGTIRWIEDHGALLHDQRGQVNFATGIAKDITDQKQNEEMLRRLSARLITAQEAERSRIARELHDHVNQTLALLSVELEQFGRVPSSSPARPDAMQAMQQRLKALSSDIHAMSHRLHPSKLKHLGLVSAMRALCRDMEESGLHVHFADRDIPRTLPEDVALTLYRVAQEGLQNVRKHGGTDSVDLDLTRQSAVVTLLIRDRGKGFDPSLLECSDGLGLVSMTERVGCVGGTLAIRSAPGAGTEIEACVPIHPEPVPA